jgi:hypothetical protein
MIRERVKSGLERARAQGKTLGRPPIDAENEAAIRAVCIRARPASSSSRPRMEWGSGPFSGSRRRWRANGGPMVIRFYGPGRVIGGLEGLPAPCPQPDTSRRPS